MILLRALAGSRLYGTASALSDWDWYEVHDECRPHQGKNGDQDVIKMPLSKWLRLCEKGTHQALDAMWCPNGLTTVDKLLDFRLSWRPDTYRVADQLERTAYGIGNEKHKPRLLHCAESVREYGWYDPTEFGRRSTDDPQA